MNTIHASNRYMGLTINEIIDNDGALWKKPFFLQKSLK